LGASPTSVPQEFHALEMLKRQHFCISTAYKKTLVSVKVMVMVTAVAILTKIGAILIIGNLVGSQSPTKYCALFSGLQLQHFLCMTDSFNFQAKKLIKYLHLQDTPFL